MDLSSAASSRPESEDTLGIPAGRILIVHDGPCTPKALVDLPAGLATLRFAMNAYEAFHQARDAMPDLLILDTDAPQTHCLRLFQSFRDDPQWIDVPTIAISSRAELELAALDMGMLDFIKKPVDPAIVTARIGNHLQRQRIVSRQRSAAHAHAQQLAAIVLSSNDAIIGKDLSGRITFWNSAAQQMFGFSAAEMIGSSIMRLIPADRQDEEEQILHQIRRGERVQHFETVRRTKDQRSLNVSVTVSPIKNTAGEIIGASKIVREVTEISRMRDATRE